MKRTLIRIGGVVAGVALLSLLSALARPQTPAASNLSDLLTQADATFKQMSAITGLPIKAPLRKRVVSRSEITQLVQENLETDYTPDELRAEEASLKAFGLAPPDFDLRKFLISFYTEQAAGFYDPKRKTMFIADWVQPSMQKIVLAHELTHALQDQNFGLRNYLQDVRQNDDAANAREAVVEGYATAAMMQSMLPAVPIASLPSLEGFMNMASQQDPAQYPVFSHAPFFFKFQALFPYSRGLDFIQQLLRHGGWKGLDQLFVRPPVNTKEVFDPAIYLAAEPQPAITLPSPPALSHRAGFSLVTENSMGEEGYYSLIGQLLSEDKAKALAPSWIADRYLIYTSPVAGEYALISRVRWSNPQAAQQFFEEYERILGRKYAHWTKAPGSDATLVLASTNRGSVILLNRGNEVRWIEGAPPSQVPALVDWIRGL